MPKTRVYKEYEKYIRIKKIIMENQKKKKTVKLNAKLNSNNITTEEKFHPKETSEEE